MKSTLAFSTALILGFSGFVQALPHPFPVTEAAPEPAVAPDSLPNIFARQAGTVSPDGTCGVKEAGAGNGYRCPTTIYGCCSQHGWCGGSEAHCGAGCQAAYGACSGSPESTTTTSLPSPTGSRPRLGNVPYGVTLTSCTVPGTVALTFDDGPHIYTQELLSILNAEGVKATFFVNGQNWGAPITSDSSLAGAIRDVYNSGHQIASHTWSHPNLDSLDAASIKSQMNQLEGALLNIIGRYPTYMRAPYLACGGTCLSVMNELGYHVMGTNLDTLDWQFNTDTTNWQSQQIFNNAVSSTSGSTGKWLVLSHDVHRTTVKLLAEYMIETAQQKGYRLVTVGECMGDPSSNWYRTSL